MMWQGWRPSRSIQGTQAQATRLTSVKKVRTRHTKVQAAAYCNADYASCYLETVLCYAGTSWMMPQDWQPNRVVNTMWIQATRLISLELVRAQHAKGQSAAFCNADFAPCNSDVVI